MPTRRFPAWEGNMRFSASALAAISFVTFTVDIAAARARDNPNSGYEASGQRHTGQANDPLPNSNASGKNTSGKKNK
jgi:hypothetical protein